MKKVSLYSLITVVLSIVIINVVDIFWISAVVSSDSMYPSLSTGERVIVERNTSLLKRGDILVFKSNSDTNLVVKRVIAIGGDEISISNGIVTVNGTTVDESYCAITDTSYSGYFVVPEKCIFFLGDNRETSYDSRYWESPYIKEEDVVGRVVCRYWPTLHFYR